MSKITLSKAFVIRKRLLKSIADKTKELLSSGESFFVEEGKKLPKIQAKERVEEINKIRAKLVNLNNLIDKANATGPRDIINKIEGLKEEKRLASSVVAKISGYTPEIEQYDSNLYNEKTGQNGAYRIRKFIFTAGSPYANSVSTDEAIDDWSAYLSSFDKEIEKAEDELAELNASTFIDFD